jgi:hypothetical protein
MIEMMNNVPQVSRTVGYWLPERKKHRLDLDRVAKILR